jgi:hypothetical protein
METKLLNFGIHPGQKSKRFLKYLRKGVFDMIQEGSKVISRI